jgi:polyisoprenoid-binding protein YceI
MKNALLLLVATISTTLLPTILLSAQYRPVDPGSEITFTVNNFGFAVDGHFTGVRGTIDFDPEHAAAGRFDVTIDASTVNTGNSMRDSHLKNDGYFDVVHYPRIRLVSTRVTEEKPGSYTLTGELTIKDKTKSISFPFTAIPANGGMAFKGSFTINRKDFGVGGSSTIANTVTVSINVMTSK